MKKTLLFAGLCLGLIACSEKKTETPSSTPAATAAPTAPQAQAPAPAPAPPAAPLAPAPQTNPKEAMTQAFQAFLQLKSFRADMATKSDKGEGQTSLEFVAPDRYRMHSTNNYGGQTTHQTTILIGAQTYMKMGEAPWRKLPVNIEGMVRAFRDPKMIEQIQKSTEVQFAGEETLDGQAMKVYRYQVEDPLGLKVKSDCKAWISPADNLPRRIEVDGEYAGIRSHTTISYSDFNADLKIETPL